MTANRRFYFPSELGEERAMLGRLKKLWRRFSSPDS